jgi:polar amino acid transport system substrate-binding protein
MVSSIDARQMHTRDHSENVAAYAVAIGQALGLGRDRIMRLLRAPLLHDIGKITVPRYVLAKPRPLDDDQFALIKRHPEVGGTMLAHTGLADEALWIRHHHERIDGAGYPSGLAGDDRAGPAG